MSAKKRKSPAGKADPHLQREQARYESPIASREHILTVLSAENGPMDFEALAERLKLDADPVAMEALRRRVGAMKRDGQLIQNRRRGLVPVDTDALVAGRISAHADGFGFVIADDGDKDIYLNGKQMRQVLHGDRVVVCITGTDHRNRREGRIVDVVERANKTLVGKLVLERGTCVVLPDNKRIHQDLLITPDELSGASDGDIVVAEITEQPTRRHQPVGRIVEVLGQHLRPGMEIDVALHSHGIPFEWPQAVTDQAAGFSTTVPESAADGRKDVRALPLITIDGADARDFDDAVCCTRTETGWHLMVAIADVAYYVEPGSSLDQEAIERGTSVYFPGRVVPMLPEVLSNGLCSLNPSVDRLCMLCEMTLDADGSQKKVRFHNAIMRSHARLTYSQVHEMLTEPGSPLRQEHDALMPMIQNLHELYKVLSTLRAKRGAIEFDSTETRIVFDDNKKIREIVPVVRNDAHKLIEECMILANISAAAYLEQHEIPALYRVHNGPKSDRLEDLRAFLALRSLSLGGGDSPSALHYAELAEAIRERPDRSVVQTVMLRSMQQAVYQPKNEGHFGLALNQYAHFTSPIRRYPDLLVHRAIKHVLEHGGRNSYRYSPAAMLALGESCSTTERRAEEASRDVVAWLKCEYMQEHVGSEFPGVVSAVTSFGLFVDLTGIHIEGLIHVTNLSRDFYHFDQAAHALVGERTGQQYHLGDAMVVQIAAVNLEERKIDFAEVEHIGQKGKRTHTNAKTNKSGSAQPDQSRSQRKRQRRKEKSKLKEKAQAVVDEILLLASNADAQTVDPEADTRLNSAKKKTAKAAGKPRRKTSSKKTRKVAKKATGKVTRKVTGKVTGKAAKKAAKKAANKTSKKVAQIAAKKTAKKAATKANKKTAGKTTRKTTKKTAARTSRSSTGKSANSTAGKINRKSTAKKTSSRTTKKTAKQTAQNTTRNTTRNTASRTTKKTANRTTKKSAAATNSRSAADSHSNAASNTKRKTSGKTRSKTHSKKRSVTRRSAANNSAESTSTTKVAKKRGKSVAKKTPGTSASNRKKGRGKSRQS